LTWLIEVMVSDSSYGNRVDLSIKDPWYLLQTQFWADWGAWTGLFHADAPAGEVARFLALMVLPFLLTWLLFVIWACAAGGSPGRAAIGLRLRAFNTGGPVGGRALVRSIFVLLPLTVSVLVMVILAALKRPPEWMIEHQGLYKGLWLAFFAVCLILGIITMVAGGPFSRAWYDKASGSWMADVRATRAAAMFGGQFASPAPAAGPWSAPQAPPFGQPGLPTGPASTGPIPTGPIPPGPPPMNMAPPDAPAPAGPVNRVPVMPGRHAAAASPEEDGPANKAADDATQVINDVPPGGYLLVFDTDEKILVEGTGLVGRRPEADDSEDIAHLIAIDDPDKSVSNTHLSFGLDDDKLWVRDHGSTNGTVIVTRNGSERAVFAGEAETVQVGDRVLFGEREFEVRGA
jgi:hypothetical protein